MNLAFGRIGKRHEGLPIRQAFLPSSLALLWAGSVRNVCYCQSFGSCVVREASRARVAKDDDAIPNQLGCPGRAGLEKGWPRVSIPVEWIASLLEHRVNRGNVVA
jgi:hypothetical protein